MPSTSVSVAQRTGCVAVKSFTKHWMCLFPQHGPGRKHTRPIILESWQQDLVDRHTGPFLRGLFHSDGCRITNRATRTVDGRTTRREYPRWFFSNESVDILGLCSAALDRLGIAHRFPKYNTISVARREAVAALDEVVGPKGLRTARNGAGHGPGMNPGLRALGRMIADATTGGRDRDGDAVRRLLRR